MSSEMLPIEATLETSITEMKAAPPQDSMVQLVQVAEQRIQFIKRIKSAALQVTNIHDWVDQGGKPYLTVSGAQKIARLFGIGWKDLKITQEYEEAGHYSYICRGKFCMGSAEIEETGARSSKDPFFCKKSGKGSDGTYKKIDIPPSEIDKNDIMKSALTNCLGRGITAILGIRSLTWEDLEMNGIDKAKVSSVDYKKKSSQQQSSWSGKASEKQIGFIKSLFRKKKSDITDEQIIAAINKKDIAGFSEIKNLSDITPSEASVIIGILNEGNADDNK